ncbi:MAG: copper chaperone PCu(A)C [Microthrixaceae bacterium]|nr:copper chaperone PCu(A)C [Microthrixaceae bacterium]
MNLTPTRSSAIRRSATVLAALSLGVAALSGCSSDDDATDTSTTVASAQDTTTTAATDGELTMTGAWARTSPMMASNGAIYMEITNATDADDALLSVSVDPSIAATAELHETRAAGGDMGGDMGSSTTAPMMEMAEIDRLDIAAGEAVSLQPGGYHIMLMNLAAPLTEGQELVVTLTFENAGDIEVTAVVGDGAP